MEFILKWLAQLYETFKQKSPIVATVILLLLSVTIHTADQGQLWGLFHLPDLVNTGIKWVSMFLLAVTGTQTFRYLPSEVQEKIR